MFQKLFNKVDEFIEKFKELNTFEELSKITIDVLQIIKEEVVSPPHVPMWDTVSHN